jgi:N4-(beta-N-acetylglucosaminyl)-L-asparaginase
MKLPLALLPLLLWATTTAGQASPGLPMVINTWGGPFTAATDTAYLSLVATSASALDAVQIGCATCERNQCDGSVGYGGSPDENCETTLDAMIQDGTTMKSGAVAGLRRVRDAIAVARLVLDYTDHTLLAGDLATEFAVGFGGFAEENLTTTDSAARCNEWRAAGCQPNYRSGALVPDASTSCGPYAPAAPGGAAGRANIATREVELKTRRTAAYGASAGRSHDTISMVAIHVDGTMAAGTSTNGASHKVPGRVGDGPITGSGSYVDGDVGGCGATGDGDIMMRFLPCYQAVESMRRGMSPKEAAEDAVSRMIKKYPQAATGIVVVNNKGEHGGAASGWTFTYAYRGGTMDGTEVVTVPPLSK